MLIIMAAALLFSCKKDISQIGVNVVGDNPLEVIYVDTFSIVAHSEVVDSMRTDELSSHLFGAYKDPVFGTINASIYSQFRLEAGNIEFEFPDDGYDSIVLYLAYADSSVYGGDPNFPSQNHISVYEVGDQLYKDSAYYHFQNLRTKDELLGELVFTPSFDSVEFYEYNEIDDKYDTVMKVPSVAIRLNDEFGQRIFNYGPEVFESVETLLQEFAGIYVTTLDQHLPSSDGSLVNFNFLSADTKIALYYHYLEETEDESGSTVTDTIYETFDLICNTNNTARFGNYNHYDYFDASPEFKSQVIDGNTSLGEEALYLQSLAGVRTYISFPYLNKMDDYYNYAVNEAKLFLWDINDPASQLSPISSLSLSYQVEVDSILRYYTIPDAASGGNYFSGEYNQSQENYFFRITQYLQDLIRGDTDDNQIRVEIIGSAVNANRSVIGGYDPLDESKKLKLQVIYTKIDADE